MTELTQALRELHEAVGGPSSRAISELIADAGGKLSHSAVSTTLRGHRTPKLGNLLLIVSALGGDTRKFEQLWRRNQSDKQIVEMQSTKVPLSSRRPGDVSVFVSYSHQDDKSSHGRIRRIAEDISSTYSSITGLEVGIFFDTATIKLGDDWRSRIAAGLDDATVLLAFISPAYLRSAACREELSSFLAFLPSAKGRKLLIPILIFAKDRIHRYFEKDELWKNIQQLQWLEAAELRQLDIGSMNWMQKIEIIAERIEEALAELEAESESSASIYQAAELTLEREDIEGEGSLEIIARAEEELPEVARLTIAYSEMMNKFGEIVQKHSDRMAKADTFGKRLAIATNLAEALHPVSDESIQISGELRKAIDTVSPGLLGIIRMATASGEAKSEDMQEFFGQIKFLAQESLTASRSVEEFMETLDQGKGFSKKLDGELNKMRQSLLLFAETRSYYSTWIGEVDMANQVVTRTDGSK